MRRLILSALMTAATVTLTVSGAQATDIFSQESTAHVLTLTTKTGAKTVEIAAKGEIRDVCDGCTIALKDGQTVEPTAGDIVFLVDGKLIVYED